MASRIGIEDRHSSKPKSPPKKRLRFTNVPLDVSDFTLEDMVKEFAIPIYSNFYDYKDSRSAVFEFEDPSVMERVVEKYNGTPLNDVTITVEIFEQGRRGDKRRRNNNRDNRRGMGRGSRGSHYKRQEDTPATEDQLNAELEDYMKSS